MDEQPTESIESLTLSIEKVLRADTAIVIATRGTEPVHRDSFDLNKADKRCKFARAINAKIPSMEPTRIETDLLRLLDDLKGQAEREQANATEPTGGEELDAMEMTRPELIFRGDFAAMAVPRLMDSRTGPDGVWTLYARRGSKRTIEELEPSIIAGTVSLHVHPMPLAPSVSDVSDLNRWSKQSREQWLRGEARPTTDDVITAIMDRINRFIELPPDPAADAETGSIGHAITLTLWVMLSYVYPIFPAVAYL